MSLSTQYLEELSRRYKKQMEEMQRLFDKTLNSLKNEDKKKDEHNKRLEKELEELKQIVHGIMAERNSFSKLFYFILLAIVLIFCFVNFCRKPVTNPQPSHIVEVHRRSSVDVISRNKPPKKQRRPSEEALKIKGSYKELMVDQTNEEHVSKNSKKRKKRKESPKSTCFATVTEESENVIKTLNPSGISVTAPAVVKSDDWVENNEIKDVPVILDESEHTVLESTPSINGDTKYLQSFMQTAREVRLKRSFSNTIATDTNGNKTEMIHGNLDSVNDTETRTESLNGNVSIEGTPKREKKGLFKMFKRK